MIAFSKKYWYIIVIAISLTGNVMFLYTGNEDYFEEYQKKIEELQKKVDVLKIKNNGLKSEIVELEKKSDSLDTEIEGVRNEKKNIIRSYEIYLQNVLDLDDSELERWFITRYSDQSTDTDSSTSSY